MKLPYTRSTESPDKLAKFLACALLFFAAPASVPTVAFAQDSPYSVFQAMSQQQLATLQVKLTYVGPQTKKIYSVAFTSPSNTVNLALFVPFQRPGISYNNDNSTVLTFVATTADLSALISNVGTLPNVTAGGTATNPFISFTLLNTVAGTQVFEAVLNNADAAALFAQVRLALQDNATGLKVISEQACPTSLIDPTRPIDVSSSTSVALSGVRLNRATGQFVGSASVKNNSSTSLSGPLSVVMNLSGNVSLANANGTTCGTTPVGIPFINLPLSNNTLAPGAVAQVTVEFTNPALNPITPTTKVLAGPGAR